MTNENGSRNVGSANGRAGEGAHTGTGGSGRQPVKGLEWRCIGPHRGGRVVAVAGDPVDPATFYFGACAGGVWKTTDGGQYWECVSDGYFNTAAVGAIAVSESDPNVIYVGTGETAIRGNVSHGDGVYKSTDAGKTWTNVGLADTRHIARVRIHPRNPDLVYVAALGHAWGPNRERGVFRSTDGGRSWEQVLFRSERAGAIDLCLDPTNPRVLYATLWEAQRYPYALKSGGPDSGIFRSTDGGDTWQEISRNPGLPTGVLGKIGVAAAPRSGRVYAIVEAEDGALFRSDDGGNTWQRLCEEGDLRRRAWYYQHIYADPQDADTVWVLNLQCWKSVDGGKSFTAIPTPHGDNHDLWLDPGNPRRLIEGNDGGACVSYNGGESFSTIYNQPTAQFYHATTDNQVPYRVYGSQQDNSAITLPSQSANGAITETEWHVPGGGESGYIAIRPDNPNVVFAGAIGSGPGHGRLLRYDHATKQVKNITVWPEINGMGAGAESAKYRFQWTFPIELSPHDPNVLYVCSQHVHRSTDEGMSWEVISPDLTRNDPEKLKPSGGPITRDNTGAEFYCTIFAFLESPHERGTFWAGTDDGLIHLSRDGGQSWQNVTPRELPEWSLISIIEQSPHDPATVYVAATRYKLDDTRPYLYKTNDYGRSWTRITNGIPETEFTRTIREDPGRRGLLYAGTETGVYVSFDDGANWEPLQLNLPVCPIHDLHVKDNDLIAATHGRSFWILDDLTPLHALADEIRDADAHLFRPRPTRRYRVYRRTSGKPNSAKQYTRIGPVTATYYMKQLPNGQTQDSWLDAGQNPPEGVIVSYWLKAPAGEISLEFLDSKGKLIKRFTSGPAAPAPAGPDTPETPTETLDVTAEGMEGSTEEPIVGAVATAGETDPNVRVPVEAGLNRFVWNMRYADARGVPGDDTLKDLLAGPIASTGRYQVRLNANGQSYTEAFEIEKDPRVSASQADLDAQFDLWLKIRDKLSQTHDAVNAIRSLRAQIESWEGRFDGSAAGRGLAESARALKTALGEVEGTLIEPRAADSAKSPLSYPTALNGKLATLTNFVASADGRPTRQCYEIFDDLSARIDRQLDRLSQIVEGDLARFNQAIRDANLDAVSTPPIGATAGAVATPAD